MAFTIYNSYYLRGYQSWHIKMVHIKDIIDVVDELKIR